MNGVIIGLLWTGAVTARYAPPPRFDHLSHSEFEAVFPPLLRAHPSVAGEVRSSHSIGRAAGQENGLSPGEVGALPVLAVSRTIIDNCVGGRVYVNVSTPPAQLLGFKRNESDWIGLYSPAVCPSCNYLFATLNSILLLFLGLAARTPNAYIRTLAAPRPRPPLLFFF